MAVTRTKASEVFGTYGTRPLDLHGDWYLVSCHARLLGMELIAHCKDPADLRLPVGADWRETLCAKLIISGPDRRNAKVALNKLVDAGFLHHEDSHVRISLVPEQKLKTDSLRIQSGSTSVSLRSQSGSTPDPKTTQANEIVHVENVDREIDREEREQQPPLDLEDFEDEEEEPEPEPLRLFRTPLGEPPPGFVDREETEPTLEQRIVRLWQRGVGDKGGGQPPETKRARDGAEEVAKWLRSNVRDGETPLSAFQAALKLYLAEDKESLRRNSWPLAWLVERLPGYRAPAPKPEAPKSNNPTHQVWKAPDYEAEMRDSYDPERIRRQREEIFAGDPEGLARAEEVEREMAERAAAAPRVVVSIAEAKPQVKPGYRTKTPEEIAERKRLLEEQVRALKAASAAE